MPLASRIFACMVSVVVIAWTHSSAMAQAFPSRQVRIISPFASGTGPDVVIRLLAEKLKPMWNQPIVVEPKPGASGFFAMTAAKDAIPDGHTLVIVSDAHVAANQFLYRNLPYDPEKDFVPVARILVSPFFVMVSATGPYKNVADIVAAARVEPLKISYGTPSIGSPTHLGAALLEALTGTKMLHVPFREVQEMFVAIANEEVSWAIASVASALVHLRAGRIKAIAIAARTRSPAFPDIPTVSEAGGPELYVNSWVAILAPRGTPDHLIKQLNADINKVVSDAGFGERLRAMAIEPAPMSPEELTEFIRAEAKRNADVVRRVGVIPQ